MTDLELARLKFDYCPETGVVRRKSNGKPVGAKNNRGYLTTRLNKKTITVHRLAWLLFNGEWPSGDVDHINGNKADNRLANLRIATNAENQHSIFKAMKNSKTGVRGVTHLKNGFLARIRANGERIVLGIFPTLAEARAAYLAAKEKLQPASSVARPHFIHMENQA